MVDKSMKKPYGWVEDIFVKVEDHYIPANFIVLDTGEEEDDSVILGRLFLATANAIIYVLKRAARLYAASWVHDISPDLRPEHCKKDEMTANGKKKPATRKRPSTLEDLGTISVQSLY
ncbi:uncharacterized protein LOC107494036 [Arachis duranensis]|uniref:Uncharacterized protein LOC107494036 n=1 Tax=Arachis duranensis TaxID=130453 RepID=A0A6P4DLZ4_ARADU|nr:uncharacterized protein LOC107494036 [Arachis duranensis]